MRIIALHGKAGAGKDTFADRLVEKHGFVKRGFADPLYEEVAAAFDVGVGWLRDRQRKESPQDLLRVARCRDKAFRQLMEALGEGLLEMRSPRWVLQKWGTEYRRGQNDRHWLMRMNAFIWQFEQCPDIVIPDCRFENEAQWVKENGGLIAEIKRSGLPPVAAHSSEAGAPTDLIDRTFYNDWHIAGLHMLVDRFMDELLSREELETPA